MGKVITNIVNQNSTVTRIVSSSNGTLERSQQNRSSSPTIFNNTSFLENTTLTNNQQNFSSLPSNITQPTSPITGEIINLNKKVYIKNQYEKVIDTKFSQLASPPTITTTLSPEELINKFFQDYENLFYVIPKTGVTNSHEYLIKTSTEYINYVPLNDDLQALIDEINLLQQQNLELNQRLVELQTSGSQTNG